jgi:hypothetical protein
MQPKCPGATNADNRRLFARRKIKSEMFRKRRVKNGENRARIHDALRILCFSRIGDIFKQQRQLN